MRAVEQLPEGYREIYSVNLQKDKKMAFWLNAAAAVISIAMAVPMAYAVPIATLFDMEAGFVAYGIRFVSLLVLSVVYIILHEAIHGVAMKICGTKKIQYGFTGMYAFAGSNDHYGKAAYIFIALAPVVVWGIVLAAVNCVVPVEWFWVVYIVQIMNISGAAGDLFVTLRFLRMPKDILVRDMGVSMKVYSKQQQKTALPA